MRSGRKLILLADLFQLQAGFVRSSGGLRWLAPAASMFSSQSSNALNLSAGPHSLEYPRSPPRPEAAANPSILSQVFLKIGGYYSKESTLMRAAEGLYACVTEHATQPTLLQALDIPDDFQHRHAALCLHVWLLLVRLRAEGPDGKRLAQMMYDNFQDDVERMVRAAVKVRVSKQLTELEKQFYGSGMAYDAAMKEDPKETLAEALLRNVYQADPGKREAARKLERSGGSDSTARGTSGAALVAIAAGLAAFFWWKRRQQQQDPAKRTKGSPFKFPAGKAPAASGTGAAASSSLPRNKTSNNKKNKARKKEEKQRRAEAKEQKATTSSAGGGDEGQPSTSVVNYTYFDSARRDTIFPTHKKKDFTAADAMQPK